MGNANQRCQSCGAVAPTRYVDFKQNVGMLLMRRSSSVTGELCKPCVHQHFWKMTGTTLAVGWLGRISLFIAPVYVVNNVIRYVSVLGMPGAGSAAKPGTRNGVKGAAPVVATAYAPPRVSTAAPLPLDEEPEPFELLPVVSTAEVIKPYWSSMVARLKAKETLESVASDVASQTGLAPDEVAEYVKARIRQARAAKAAAAGMAPATDRV